MAVTATLVFVGHNFLRYLIAQDGNAGTSVTITTTGAATPDLQTDSLIGPIKNLSKVVANGFGQFAAGVQTQAKSRALWLSDWSGATPGNVGTITAACQLAQRTGALGGFDCAVDANVDGGGNPTVVVTTQAAAGQAYLDVRIPNAIGA